MLNRHSLPVVPKKCFTLKRYSLPTLQKIFDVKGAHSASEAKLYFYVKRAVFADNTKFHVKEVLFTNSAKEELHVNGTHLPLGQNFIFMLKGHSLLIKPEPNVMLKRHSLPEAPKEFHVKGAHFANETKPFC